MRWRWLRPYQPPLVGPLFRFELLRLSRNGRIIWLRAAYALTLLVLVWTGLWRWHSRISPEATLVPGVFAEELSLSLLVVQCVAVLVLAPLFLGTAIVEERNRGTLDLLFTTHLHAREIVLGKLLARCYILATIVVAGLPILLLLHFLGGTDFFMILGGFAITGITLLLAGSISICCSIRFRRTGSAIAASYAWLVLIMLIPLASSSLREITPIEALLTLDWRLHRVSGNSSHWLGPAFQLGPAGVVLETVMEFFVRQGVIALLFLAFATRKLRRPQEESPQTGVEVASTQLQRAPYSRPMQQVDDQQSRWGSADNPLWRKEAPSPSSMSVTLFYMLLAFLGIWAFSFALASVWSPVLSPYNDRTPEQILARYPVLLLNFVTLAGLCLFEGLRTVGCVSQERERRTLESLLTLPVSRGTILRIKLLAGGRYFLPVIGIVSIFSMLASLTGIMPFVSTMLTLVAGFVHMLFFAALGLWLSVVCRTTLQARVILGIIVFLLLAGPALLAPSGWSEWQWVVSPPQCWMLLSFPKELVEVTGARAGACALAVCFYAEAALILWSSACYLFQRNRLGEKRDRSTM